MKLIIDQSPGQEEVEITVKCALIDERLSRLIEMIRLYAFSIAGKKDGRTYSLKLEDVYYFESVDRKTFAYTEGNVYECEFKLYELEEQLAKTNFVRIGKAAILNVSVLQSVRALMNGRMEAELANGEKMIISRHYVAELKKKLGLGGE